MIGKSFISNVSGCGENYGREIGHGKKLDSDMEKISIFTLN